MFIEGLQISIFSSSKEVWLYSLSYVETSVMCVGTALDLSMEGTLCCV